MSMLKLQIVLVPPKALDLQVPNIPVNSTPNSSMNWQNNSNARIRFPNFNLKQNNTSLMMNNDASKNLQNMKLKLNQMIAYKNYLFQKNCKKFLLFVNLQSDLNHLADEILIKFNKLYPGYDEELNILTIQDNNGNDLDPDFIIKDVFNTSNVVKVLIEKDIDWDNPTYLGSKFGSGSFHKRRKLNPRGSNSMVNTTVVANNTSLRFTTPIVHEYYRDIDSIMMEKSIDQSVDSNIDKSMDKSILLPPSKPQAPQIRVSSGVDHSKIIMTGQTQLDTVSKSAIVDPDKSKQHILHTQPSQPIVLADQSSPKGTLLGTPVMTVISPNKLTASEQKSYSTSVNQFTDTVIHHSPTNSSSTTDLPPPLKTPRNNNENDILTNNNDNILLPFTESGDTKISSKNSEIKSSGNNNNDNNNNSETSVVEESKQARVPMPRFDRPSALSKSMRASLQRQQSTIANDKGSPVKNGPLSDAMTDNVHLAELPTKNNITTTSSSSVPQPTESNIKTKSILEKIMEHQGITQSIFDILTDRQSQKEAKEIKKRQIINHNSYITVESMKNVTKEESMSLKQTQEDSSVVHENKLTADTLPQKTTKHEAEKTQPSNVAQSSEKKTATSEQEITAEVKRKEVIKPAKPAEGNKQDDIPLGKKNYVFKTSTDSKSIPLDKKKVDTNIQGSVALFTTFYEKLRKMGSHTTSNVSQKQPEKVSNELSNMDKTAVKSSQPASISVSRNEHSKDTTTEKNTSNNDNRSDNILISSNPDKGTKGIENSNLKMPNVLNSERDKTAVLSQPPAKSAEKKTDIAHPQPINASDQTSPRNQVSSKNNTTAIASTSKPSVKSKADGVEEANTSVGNNSFQKSDLLRMFENNKLKNPPWLSKSNNSTAHRVIGKARNKPYLTVLNKDIDNSKPDPRNILPSRTPRNAAQKATMKLTGQTIMPEEADNLDSNNNINGSEEFESYSESGGEYESSSSSGIMTDVSSDEEDIATLAKATPDVKITKPDLKESIVRHVSTDSDGEPHTNPLKANTAEPSTNISKALSEPTKPPIQLTQTTGNKKVLSDTDKLLDTDLSDLDASINTRKGKDSSRPPNTTEAAPKTVSKVLVASKTISSPKPTHTLQNTIREATPLLSSTMTSNEHIEGHTPNKLLSSDKSDMVGESIASVDKKTTTKLSSKLTTQSKPPKYSEYSKNGRTTAFMDYLSSPKAGEDLLLDLDSTDSADDASLSSSSESDISIEDMRAVPTPLGISRHGSDLDVAKAISESPTNKPRSASSMLHSFQDKSASMTAKNGLEAVTNTSTNVTGMVQRLSNTGIRGIPSSMSIDIAPSSDALSDQEIDNDIPETSSDYESSGVELDD